MALGPRLDLRQSQSLVMTPQLQQAIKLLALSNLEIEAFIGDALDSNPLLELGEAASEGSLEPGFEGEPEGLRRTTLESSPVDQLVSEGRAADDRPLDIDATTLDGDRDTAISPTASAAISAARAAAKAPISTSAAAPARPLPSISMRRSGRSPPIRRCCSRRGG